VELRHREDQEGLAGAGRGRDCLPSDPLDPGRSEEGFEVTVFEPGQRLAIRGQLGPFRARIGYLLEAVPGGTRLTNDVALDPSPGVLRLAARLATPRVKTAVAENLGKLKEILEARDQQGGG
jgi:hypothetical protein